MGATSLKVKVSSCDDESSLATLEDVQELRNHFSNAPIWGQAASQEGRYVMTKRALRCERKRAWKAQNAYQR